MTESNRYQVQDEPLARTMKEYMPRIVDEMLDFKLRTKGAVWIRGPKGCGKTTTAMRASKTAIMMQDESAKEQNIALAKMCPSELLKGDAPLLIDEWQTIPFIWNQIRFEVDNRDGFGQFILTGSSMPRHEDMIGQHSGIGRIIGMTMRPMSLFESGESCGSVSLKGLFSGIEQRCARHDLGLKDYAFLTARGGWPEAVVSERDSALQPAVGCFNQLVNGGTRNLDESARDPDRLRLFLRAYARSCSSGSRYPAIKEYMAAIDGGSLDTDTIASYVKSMSRLFVIEESEAWNPNLRSKAAIRTSNTRYFVDPSIACAALGTGPEGLIKDLGTFGLLFENLCVRDLRIYSEPLGGTVKHYRDSNGLEADAVIILGDGSWGAVEVKLGSQDLIDEGERNLLKLASSIGNGMKKPSFLMVLTATSIAYRTENGVWVVPLGCLGP